MATQVMPAVLGMVPLLHQKLQTRHTSCLHCGMLESDWGMSQCPTRARMRDMQIDGTRRAYEQRLHELLNELAGELKRDGFAGSLQGVLTLTANGPDNRTVHSTVFVGTVDGDGYDVFHD